MFKITDGKGFQITFANGWTVSVQFGPGNYGDNYSSWSQAFPGNSATPFRQAGERGSRTAEIAAWDSEGRWHGFGSDQVRGYVSPDEVLQFMNFIAEKEA